MPPLPNPRYSETDRFREILQSFCGAVCHHPVYFPIAPTIRLLLPFKKLIQVNREALQVVSINLDRRYRRY
jgi:hypothetical protein